MAICVIEREAGLVVGVMCAVEEWKVLEIVDSVGESEAS